VTRNSLNVLLPLAAVLALAACSSNLPEGSSPRATAAVVTPPQQQPIVIAGSPFAPAPVYVVPSTGQQYVTVVPQGSGTSTFVAVPTRLSANEALAVLSDNTATGTTTNGQVYYAYFKRDGELQFAQPSYRDRGAWRVSADGSLCSRLSRTNSGVEQCYVLYRDGNNIRFDRPDGARVGTFTVEPGNVRSL
jgi:hypothetical protein